MTRLDLSQSSSELERMDAAAKAVAVELGFCDPDEWDAGIVNDDDRDRAYRAGSAALDAVLLLSRESGSDT